MRNWALLRAGHSALNADHPSLLTDSSRTQGVTRRPQGLFLARTSQPLAPGLKTTPADEACVTGLGWQPLAPPATGLVWQPLAPTAWPWKPLAAAGAGLPLLLPWQPRASLALATAEARPICLFYVVV